MAGKKDIWSLMSGAVISLTFATSAMADAPLSKEAPKATIQSPEENLRKKGKPFNKLRKTLLHNPFEIRVDTDFAGVVEGCAEPTDKRPETWINAQIFKVFCELHARGAAHSVECWRNGKLVGGIYGLALGGAFFGESMFSRETNASKVALFHLMARLWKGGFTLFDTQFVNDHLKQFGVYELPHVKYKKRLDKALAVDADFNLDGVEQNQIMVDYLEMRK